MEVKAAQNKKKPVYPAAVKTAAVGVAAAVVLAASSCQTQHQQQKPVEEGLLPGWIIAK